MNVSGLLFVSNFLSCLKGQNFGITSEMTILIYIEEQHMQNI